MIERQLLKQRRNWKGMVHDYERLIASPVDSSECLYCLTVPQTQALMMLAQSLSWVTRWIGSDIDQGEITHFSNDIIERLMMGCCPDGTEQTLYRITDTGEMQISVDGGETWVQDPEDPRFTTPSLPVLPDTVEDKACQGAFNTVEAFKDAVAQIGAVLDVTLTLFAIAVAIGGILAVLLFDPGHAFKLIPLVLEMASYLAGVSEEEYLATFTETVYDDLLCVLFCNIGSDGLYTDQNAIKSDLITQFGGTVPGNTFLLLLTCLGLNGLNNMAKVMQAGTADCSDCDCEEFHLYIAYGFGEIISHEVGSNVWVLRSHAGSGRSDLYFRFSNENLSGDPNNAACYNVNPMTLTPDGLGEVGLYQWECGQTALGLGDFESYLSGDCQCQITIARTVSAVPFEVTVTLNNC